MTPEEYGKITTRYPSVIYGLKWMPSLEPLISDDADWIPAPTHPALHFSKMNEMELTKAFCSIQSPRLIVEIGVSRSSEDASSSTRLLLAIKPPCCSYIGIDKEDRRLPDGASNSYILKMDSTDSQRLYAFMYQLGHKTIDFMFVDGWHSVNQVLKEWQYWGTMAPHGVMAFHDTNFHPGPVVVLAAADEAIFSVDYHGRGVIDWGIGIVRRK